MTGPESSRRLRRRRVVWLAAALAGAGVTLATLQGYAAAALPLALAGWLAGCGG